MKEIIGFSNYTLDEYGNVYSKFVKGGGGKVCDKLRKLSLVVDHTGYHIVSLISDEGRKVKVLVHRLVALHFIPNPEDKPQVNHKDGVKTNNCVSNLEWNTPLENTRHAILTGLKDVRQQSQWKPVQKLDLETGEVLEEFESLASACKATGAKQPNVTKVCRGLRNSASGFGWRYS